MGANIDLIDKNNYFDNHRLVTFFHDSGTGLNGFVSIHRGSTLTPAFGATRIWNYKSYEEALIDSLRLSKAMSRKAAMAGLNCGGAKAVIISGNKIRDRKNFLKSYAEKVNLLGGHFVTGADVGISREDVIALRRFSPYFVGVNVDPVRFTGLGLFYSIQVCLKEVFGSENLEGRSFAIQGVGKIGSELLKYIYPYTHDICITDIDKSALKSTLVKYPDIKIVDANEILKQKVDVFSPCALSSCLNKKTIKSLKCSIVVGGANNQLEDETISDKLNEMGILYAPDYVVNSGGLISVYAEYENHGADNDYIEKKVKGIKPTVKKILEVSKKCKRSTLVVSNKIAQERIKKLK